MKNIKFSSLSPQPLLLFSGIATLIAVPLRTFQLLNCINPQTGFWLIKDFTVPVLYTLCVLVVLVSLFLSFFSGIMPKPEFPKERNIPFGIISGICAIAFLADTIIQMSKYIVLYGNYRSASGGSSFIQFAMSSGALPLTMQSVFGVLSALYFSIIAYSLVRGETEYFKSKFIALSPVMWGICRMAYYFVEPISYRNVSQLFLQIMLLPFIMLFFLSYARIASNVDGKSSMWILWFSGASGLFLAFVSALAPLSLVITGHSDLLPADYPIQYCDLAFGLFATATLMSNMPRTINTKTDSGEQKA